MHIPSSRILSPLHLLFPSSAPSHPSPLLPSSTPASYSSPSSPRRLLRVFPEVPEGLRWCVLSSGEQQKCADMAVAMDNKSLRPVIQCLYGSSVEDCMKKIQVGCHRIEAFPSDTSKCSRVSFVSRVKQQTVACVCMCVCVEQRSRCHHSGWRLHLHSREELWSGSCHRRKLHR